MVRVNKLRYIADHLIKRSKGDFNSLVSLCNDNHVIVEYLPFVTNRYTFKDNSTITLSLKHHTIGF